MRVFFFGRRFILSKPSFLTQSFGRKSLSIVVVSILLLITTAFDTAQSQENEATNQQAVYRQIAQSFVEAGKVGWVGAFQIPHS